MISDEDVGYCAVNANPFAHIMLDNEAIKVDR